MTASGVWCKCSVGVAQGRSQILASGMPTDGTEGRTRREAREDPCGATRRSYT
jgi:hypothetical protein